jgi:hypothetical protein
MWNRSTVYRPGPQRSVHGCGRSMGAVGPWVHGPSLNNSRWFFDLWFAFNEAEGVSLDLITIVGDAMDDSRFTKTEQQRGDQAARRHHGWAWWLAGVGAGVHYGLWLPTVPGSNQSGGRGILTKGYSGRWRSPEGGARWQGFSSCPQQWWEGAPRGGIDRVFIKRVQHSVGKLVRQSSWPKTPSSGGAMHGTSG